MQLAGSKFQLWITLFENAYFLTFNLNLFLNSFWSCPLLSPSSSWKNNSGLIRVAREDNVSSLFSSFCWTAMVVNYVTIAKLHSRVITVNLFSKTFAVNNALVTNTHWRICSSSNVRVRCLVVFDLVNKSMSGWTLSGVASVSTIDAQQYSSNRELQASRTTDAAAMLANHWTHICFIVSNDFCNWACNTPSLSVISNKKLRQNYHAKNNNQKYLTTNNFPINIQ